MSSTHGCHACRGVQPGMGQHPWVPCAWRGAPGTGQHPRVLGARRGAPGMGQHPWVPGGRQGHPARGPERGVGRRWSARGSAGSAGGWERRSSAADYSSAASVACHLFPAASQAGGSSLTGLTRPHSCCHTWAAARAATRGLAPGRRRAGGSAASPHSPPPPRLGYAGLCTLNITHVPCLVGQARGALSWRPRAACAGGEAPARGQTASPLSPPRCLPLVTPWPHPAARRGQSERSPGQELAAGNW